MKTSEFIAGFAALAYLSLTAVNAQESPKPGVEKQINSSSEQADRLHGKKIQQQSLLNHFEKLDTAATPVPAKKKPVKKLSRKTH